MTRINSIEELRKLQSALKEKNEARSRHNSPEGVIQVKVAMATCSMASGSGKVMDFLTEELPKRSIPALVTKTGCMGFCYAEPTVEVTVPGKAPVIFGYVDIHKADEIIERYIRKGELTEGIIPVHYEIA